MISILIRPRPWARLRHLTWAALTFAVCAGVSIGSGLADNILWRPDTPPRAIALALTLGVPLTMVAGAVHRDADPERQTPVSAQPVREQLTKPSVAVRRRRSLLSLISGSILQIVAGIALVLLVARMAYYPFWATRATSAELARSWGGPSAVGATLTHWAVGALAIVVAGFLFVLARDLRRAPRLTATKTSRMAPSTLAGRAGPGRTPAPQQIKDARHKALADQNTDSPRW